MDHVKVHYNSSEPAQLNAHAYAQGSDIHVAPGQEQHLPHEAWHVVQQAQGRVQPTRQMKQGVPVNDDAGLEAEADTMGAMALRLNPGNAVLQHYRAAPNYATGAIQRLSMKRRGAFPAVDASFAVGAHVFVAPAKNSIDAEIPALDEDEANINVNLYFGQDYLNNELSQTYHGNGGAIKKEKARIGWDGTNNSNAVILDGHHRVIWGLYHNQEVGFNTYPITSGINLADVTYKGTPKPIVVAPKAEEKKEDVKDATPKDKTATTSAAATPVVGGVD
ncbi:DUF4157 domain-containing protein [Herbaspirillum sp. RV1423]|uniref:eCIS core domain-containing protein n=1 Tax=Herbaspirillum sp. RV1423 TaxID=1443993 RepID=UPI001E30599D